MKNLISNVFTKRLFTKNRRIMTLLFTAVILAGSVIGCGNAQSSEITENQMSGLRMPLKSLLIQIWLLSTF
ncbi:hypothetical protein SAMN05421493_10831 [Pseudobutyrivibrio sp. 49]|uniref:hypothetical protein n=1 Tax=Pseudobutyrivibrio sp. 49 TaxID=1855344 RepID=UPI000889BA4B|nr:hypothetical protein [Pseudobutyrivibrio sp. 49]SDI11199.1 hypothetical protein SAMN05421493_10831 [Pseudobutyrivibrio sp. 49]